MTLSTATNLWRNHRGPTILAGIGGVVWLITLFLIVSSINQFSIGGRGVSVAAMVDACQVQDNNLSACAQAQALLGAIHHGELVGLLLILAAVIWGAVRHSGINQA